MGEAFAYLVDHAVPAAVHAGVLWCWLRVADTTPLATTQSMGILRQHYPLLCVFAASTLLGLSRAAPTFTPHRIAKGASQRVVVSGAFHRAPRCLARTELIPTRAHHGGSLRLDS